MLSALSLLQLAFLLPSSEAAPAACSSNAVVCENQLPGVAAASWLPFGTGDATIQGYPTNISVNHGQTIDFKIKSPAAYRVEIYRFGYYGGLGSRLVTTFQQPAQSQPACLTEPATGLIDCGNWAVSASWAVPADAVSGLYGAHLVRNDTGGDHLIFFVVRDDERRADLLFQTSDATWQAYNAYGGNSLYVGNPAGRAYKVSYNRPLTVRSNAVRNSPLYAEWPMLQWLEQNGYDVSYTTDVDTARAGAELLEHKVFLSVGHDEYWSAEQRQNVLAARNAGVNLAFFTANESYWKTRWASSIAAGATPWRTLVCYKESQAASPPIDPADPPTSTGTWRDPRFASADGAKPENAMSGTIFMVNDLRDDALTVPAQLGKLRFWRNTSIANLQPGQSAALPTGTLGYEWDMDLDNGARPAGLIQMSSTSVDVTTLVNDAAGVSFGSGTATHHLTLYRAPSGALVFSAGTVQWSFGLNSNHDDGPGTSHPAPDPRMQQATVNLFADMGAQPATLQSGLAAATASTDTTPPSATITSPAPNTRVTQGYPVTIAGTAADGGGVVAGVEVSTDAGQTWHPAAGTTSWSYSWTPSGSGLRTIVARAVDDSGNLGNPSPGVTVEMGQCPCSLWSDSATPAVPAAADTAAYELGVRFRSDVDGSVTGIRFYKGPGNGGAHVGHLWSAGGALLGTVSFGSETASGWQRADFASPIAIKAGQVYVASYRAPQGHFALDRPFFSRGGVDSPPLHALSAAEGPNGVYASGSGFPSQSYQSSNYWVDVVLDATTDTTPPAVQTVAPTVDGTGVATSTQVKATFSEPMTSSTVTAASFFFKDPSGAAVPATMSYDALSSTATLVPSSPLTGGTRYTATVKGGAGGVADLAGNRLAADYSWSFTTRASTACPCSLWSASATPTVADAGDANAYELGVRFRSDVDGFVTGIRFYKGPGNGGAHVGHLWSAGGALLGTVSFGSETATGWQRADFASPVAVSAGQVYTASYTAPLGHFALDRPFFSLGPVDSPPLHALGAGEGPNGVYAPGSGFPSQSYQFSNYWVDVVFDLTATDVIPPTVEAVTPAAGASGVAVSSTVQARFSEPVAPGSLDGASMFLKNAAGDLVAATVAYNAGSNSATLTPNSALAAAATYTATVKGGAGGVADLAGNRLAADYSWSFTTGASSACPCSLWSSSATPTEAAAESSDPFELGVRFRSDVDGFVTGIRFYKGPGNGGAHVGHLWSAGGALLGTVGFGSETATGWQRADFASPVAVSAGQVYTASYTAPLGHFALDRPFFSLGPVDSPPLHALAASEGPNGVYASGSGFPDQSYQFSNYWVDVVFTTGP